MEIINNIPFKMEIKFLKEEMFNNYNNEKLIWYYLKFDEKDRMLHNIDWQLYIVNNEVNIPFFTWFHLYSIEQKINFPFIEKIEVTTDDINKVYYDPKSKNPIISSHPPCQDIIIKKDNEEYIGQPLSKHDNNDKKSLSTIIYQNNYTNEILNTIGQQLDRIENNKQVSTPSDNEKKINIEENPLFVPYNIDTTINLGKQDSILREIEDKLAKLNISNENINVINKNDSEDNISELEGQFDYEINKIKNNYYTPKPETRNYYPRPTPPDLQYEERHTLVQSRYDGSCIYEWNIDGCSEYQIINLLQEMTMASNAYKSHNKDDEQKVFKALISGFTGSLKGWWDMYVSPEEREIIFNAKKTIIKKENNLEVETEVNDCVNTLIFAILKNFVGNPTAYQDRSATVLLNLNCRKLQDFRWYKDIFLSKVMLRSDCKEAYWKERFIAGLPKLFAERIRNKLNAEFNNSIPYKELTYGEIINYVNQEGLAICSDLKLKAKIKKEGINNRNELGNFCEQYGYEPLKLPSSNKKYRREKRYNKLRKSKRNYIQDNKNENYNNKNENYNKKYKNKRKKYNKETIICYNCGKPGHTSRNCYVKKKINELNIPEEYKEQILKIIINEELSESDISDYREDDLNIVENGSSSSNESEECECLGNCVCEYKINGITDDNEEIKILIKLVEKIEDKEVKRIYLDKLKEKIKENNTIEETQDYNLM